MNYLAHAYLSFNLPEILVGNMISDYVKGKSQFDYPSKVQAGIRLHRAIDDFTDHHPATKQMMELFRPQYRLYAGAFVDIVFDYFLANDRNEFKSDELFHEFTQQAYSQLQNYTSLFPPRFAAMFPFMISQNWLYHYQFDEGIQKSFNGLVRRAAYLAEADIAFEIFLNNKGFLEVQYKVFFDSVKKFTAHTLQDLLKH
jgi:acyl carrier protein phosphodiesterase